MLIIVLVSWARPGRRGGGVSGRPADSLPFAVTGAGPDWCYAFFACIAALRVLLCCCLNLSTVFWRSLPSVFSRRLVSATFALHVRAMSDVGNIRLWRPATQPRRAARPAAKEKLRELPEGMPPIAFQGAPLACPARGFSTVRSGERCTCCNLCALEELKWSVGRQVLLISCAACVPYGFPARLDSDERQSSVSRVLLLRSHLSLKMALFLS